MFTAKVYGCTDNLAEEYCRTLSDEECMSISNIGVIEHELTSITDKLLDSHFHISLRDYFNSKLLGWLVDYMLKMGYYLQSDGCKELVMICNQGQLIKCPDFRTK